MINDIRRGGDKWQVNGPTANELLLLAYYIILNT
jgi:hypothetical protein